METNPGLRRPVPVVCRILCSNMRRLAGNLNDLTVAPSQYDRLLTLRLWSQMRVKYRSCWFPDSVDLSCCADARCLGPEGWLHSYEMVTEHFANPNLSLSVVVAKCWFLGFVVCDRTVVFGLYLIVY